jgi:chromosome segregation ATPase
VSAYERPDLAALAELEHLVGALTEELAGWRRRCLASEAELQEFRAQGGAAAGPELARARARVAELERENRELAARIEAARGRVAAIAQRLALVEREPAEGAA